jgi:hypothetical protein
MRRFGKGDTGQLGDLGWRLTGSADLYGEDGRSAYNSINFITCHDVSRFMIWFRTTANIMSRTARTIRMGPATTTHGTAVRKETPKTQPS